MKIDKDKLKEKIIEGKSSRHVAMQFGVSPTTIRRKAAEIGLKFNGKTTWGKG
tara:strand:- start:698 stop:856 length:159 start_codon:yes stop_codon:yes gene_type:complete